MDESLIQCCVSHPLQKLEQEKHNLRQKLLLAESDGDVRVLELQADLKELSQKLDVQEQSVRQAEREKAALIEELSQQNQRLTAQLQEANQLEAQLNAQLHEVRDQYSQRNTSLQVRRYDPELFILLGLHRAGPLLAQGKFSCQCKFYDPPINPSLSVATDIVVVLTEWLMDRLMWFACKGSWTGKSEHWRWNGAGHSTICSNEIQWG